MQIIDPNNSFNGIFSNSFLVLSDLRTKLPHLLKQFPQFDQSQIEDIANQFDPTNNKIYITWILKQIVNGNLRITNNDGIMEDAFIVNERLSQFEKIKNRQFFTHDKDINQYSTPKELYQTLGLYKEYLRDVDRKEQYKEDRKVLEDTGYVEVYNKQPFAILKVVSVSVAMRLAAGTDWCVSGEKQAKHYLDMGPLYFIYKNNEKYALLHVESQQLKDVNDDELDYEYREELEPIFVNNGIINNINYKYNILDDFEYKPTESELQYIINSASLSYYYAKEIIAGRFELGEKAIATDAHFSYVYALKVLELEGIYRFELGEPIIATSAEYSSNYAIHKIKGRFKLGEKAIATDPYFSIRYAIYALKGRFELGEPIIATKTEYSYRYAKYAVEGRFELGEKAIAANSEYSYDYALNVINDRFPLGEPAISQMNIDFILYYSTTILYPLNIMPDIIWNAICGKYEGLNHYVDSLNMKRLKFPVYIFDRLEPQEKEYVKRYSSY